MPEPKPLMVGKDFSPSYEADTFDAYKRAVESGDKRHDHVMRAGGRAAIRGAETEFPKQTDGTKKRFDDQDPPWNARTQSPAAYEAAVSRKSDLERRIKTGIDNYMSASPGRSGGLGLMVPDQPAALIKHGVPEKAAVILVSRARGKFISILPQDAASRLTKVDIKDRIVLSIRGVLSIRPQDDRVVLMDRGRRGSVLEAVMAGDEELLDTKTLEEAVRRHRENIKRTRSYDPEPDDARFFNALVRVVGVELRSGKDVVFRFRNENGPFERVVSAGEHSDSRAGRVPGRRIGYKTLRGISLSELPSLLARLSRRRSRTARENPMARKFENDNDFFRAQYSRGPFGAEQAIPVVRRNGSEVLFTAKGQPYIIEIKNGRKRARFIKKSQAARPNMAGRPGRHGLPVNAPAADPALVGMTAKQLKKLGTASAKAELARRAAGRQARAFIPQPPSRAKKARGNPWFGALFLPDTTVRREALVPAAVPYFDATQTRSALVGGKYAWNNPRRDSRGRFVRSNPSPGWEDGWDGPGDDLESISAQELRAAHRLADAVDRGQARRQDRRENREALRQIRQDAVAEAQQQAAQDEALRRARREANQAARQAERDAREALMQEMAQQQSKKFASGGFGWGGSRTQPPVGGPFAERYGQFGPSMTLGFQPVNRRNPRKRKK